MLKPMTPDAALVSALPPSVDAESQPLLSLTQACVRCGLCQPHCPTYALDKSEAESPRGRITLAAALAENRLESAFDAAAAAIDHCLGCRRCESACPAGVRFDALLVEARELIRGRRPADWRQRLLEWSIARRWPLTLGWAWLRGAQRVLPKRWLEGIPYVPAAASAGGVRLTGAAPRGRVALFTGCMAQRLDADVHRASVRVLQALGWDVWLPAGPLCCGALHRHAGELSGAQRESQATREALRADLKGCSAVLIASSGCFSDLRDTLTGIDVPVYELMAFVAEDAQLPKLHLRPSERSVVVHTPCTQSTVVGRADAASRVLSRIPHQTIHSLPDTGCCGAAGSHALIHAKRAYALRTPLLEAFDQHTAATVCSGNIGCRLHLEAGLRMCHSPTRVCHPIEVLADHLL